MPRLFIHAFAALCLIGLTAGTAFSADWPHWRGPHRNGIVAEAVATSFPTNGPKIVWQATTGTGFSSIAVADGRLFTLGNNDNHDTVHALDTQTGKTIWTHRYASPLDDKFFEGGPTSTPTVDGDRVYTLGRQGDLFCFAAATGKIIWQANAAELTGARVPGWGYSGSPLVLGDRLILNVGESGCALDKNTGKLLWKSNPSDAGYSTPLPYDDGKSIALCSAKAIFGVDVATGKQIWTHRWITRYGVNAADPIPLGDGTWFVSSGYGKGASLIQAAEGKAETIWRNKNMRNQFNGCVLIDGHLYGPDGDTKPDATLRCLDPKTGEALWTHEDFGSGSVIAAGQTLIALSGDGTLMLATADPKSFKPAAQASILEGKCWTAPALADGMLYARNAEGTVVCVDLRP